VRVALTRQDAAQAIRDTPALARLRGGRLLLTGGTGFAGSWLLELIAALNDESGPACRVVILTRNPASFAARAPHLVNRPEFDFIPGDVRTFEPPPGPFDFVVHAAAPADPISLAKDPAGVAETIVSGTRHVLELSRSAARFLFVSSGAVYSPPDKPRAAYAEAKQTAEALCVQSHEQSGLPVVIARPFTFTGPYQNLEAGFAITDFIRDGLAGGPIVVRGGSAIRSYAYGADLARWLLVILLQGTRAYDVGSDEALTVLALAGRVQTHLRALGIEATIQEENPGRPASRYLPDLSRARDELGLQLRFSLDETLINTLRWFYDKMLSR
jgi:dTDP-glucose 4,6-dehydratase